MHIFPTKSFIFKSDGTFQKQFFFSNFYSALLFKEEKITPKKFDSGGSIGVFGKEMKSSFT